MKHIHFIVNPIAGNGKSSLTKELLEQFFVKSQHHLTVKHSEFKKHATGLTKDSLKEGADVIVACGGDGTINEVASILVGTNIPLGIIPIGSGNGLASNLGIPKNLRRALVIIRNQNVIEIDVGNNNDNYFFSNTGVGFDASIIKNYESSGKRTLLGYLKACFTSFKDVETNKYLEISYNGEKLMVNPFLVFISNSNEMGYHLSLTPKASLQDGLLDVMVVTEISRLKMLWLGILILFNSANRLNEAISFQTKNLRIYAQDQSHFDSQIDGESRKIQNSTLAINIIEKGLKIIVPENHLAT